MIEAEDATVAVPPRPYITANAEIKSMEQYRSMYNRSLKDPEGFWGEMANKHLDWFRPYTNVMQGSMEAGDVAWFTQGKLNVSYNCVDRHLKTRGDKVGAVRVYLV